MRLIDADALMETRYIQQGGATIGERNYVPYTEIADAPTVTPWVNVNDRLPPEGEEVIIYGRLKYDWEDRCEYFTGAAVYEPWEDNPWATWNDWWEGQETCEVLYWYEAPEPPMTVEIIKCDAAVMPKGISIKPSIPPMKVQYKKDGKIILNKQEKEEAD